MDLNKCPIIWIIDRNVEANVLFPKPTSNDGKNERNKFKNSTVLKCFQFALQNSSSLKKLTHSFIHIDCESSLKISWVCHLVDLPEFSQLSFCIKKREMESNKILSLNKFPDSEVRLPQLGYSCQKFEVWHFH